MPTELRYYPSTCASRSPTAALPNSTHIAAAIADFTSFTFTYPGAGGPARLEADIIPAPGVLALLGIGGIAARRRRS